jgi:hypothetical protein
VTTGDAEFCVRDDANVPGCITYDGGYNNGAWHYLVGVQAAKDDRELFVDAVSRGTDATTLGTVTLNTGNIGAMSRMSTDMFFAGGLDEVRISSVGRSSGWITTEHNNQSSPSSFYTLGAAEPNGSFCPATATPTSTATNTATPTDTATATSTATPTSTATSAASPGTHYRSIGINPGILYSTGNASISAGTTTVTFSGGASLPTNVGVGDQLVIGGETFFVVSRDSPTQMTVETAAVSTHADEGYTITRAYNTLQGWEDARQGNLVSENRTEIGVAYDDGDFTAGVMIDGSTTDASHYMYLTVAAGQRHDGTAGGGVLLDGLNTFTNNVDLRDDYTRVDWFELARHRGTAPFASIEITAANVLISDVIVHDYDDPTFNVIGIRIHGSGGSSVTVRNCFIYDGDQVGIQGDEATDALTIENCTIYGNVRGISEDNGTPITPATRSPGTPF